MGLIVGITNKRVFLYLTFLETTQKLSNNTPGNKIDECKRKEYGSDIQWEKAFSNPNTDEM